MAYTKSAICIYIYAHIYTYMYMHIYINIHVQSYIRAVRRCADAAAVDYPRFNVGHKYIQTNKQITICVYIYIYV